MSSQPATASIEGTRRRLSDRQAKTVAKLTDAATKELRAKGYDGLTVRSVAKRAGVAAATAYTYFASKEHLVCEAFWRRLRDLPEARDGCAMADALRDIADLATAEPELVAAVTLAMVADDPDVKHLRDLVGAAIHARIVAAAGPDAEPEVVEALDLAMSGAMIRAGTGHMTYAEIPGRIGRLADRLMDDVSLSKRRG